MSKQILSGNRVALAQAITLVESTSYKHQKQARQLLDEIVAHAGKSMRIGITGVPGVGKSTFIESLGNYLIAQGKKVAVLAIDPSSTKSKGSILGDKTRMENLAKSKNAFIRPSPSSQAQGGVADATREAILLCEAAGFDVILVETVGVGQSETAVRSMVDFMLLLLLPGAGDELQGIKRGIVELADLLAVNKADDNLQRAKLAQAAYEQAIQLFPLSDNEWRPGVLLCSAMTGEGIPKICDKAVGFISNAKAKGLFQKNRDEQSLLWLREKTIEMMMKKFKSNSAIGKRLITLEKKIQSGKISVLSAVSEMEKMRL